ncbi:MAG TPA: tetratricopeptide repeat protein [Bryobacteraceae bacterium]|nr:tetratricopeptide repeat protein [Bryobacteraceae bacterium]
MVKLVFILLFLAVAANATGHYAGSRACFGCHAEIYRSYLRTDMGRSMLPASDLDRLNVPSTATVTTADGHVVRVGHDTNGWFQSEEQSGVFLDKHPLAYLVGTGTNGFTFLIQRQGGLFQAPLSYYSKAGKWDLSPGYEREDLGFSRPATVECVACHSGRALPVGGESGVYSNPPFAELTIGCENCHGPSEQHAQNPHPTGKTINPAKLSPRLAENICMNCHQGGDARVLQPGKTNQDFRPGQWLIETVAIFRASQAPVDQQKTDLLEHNAAMKLSRCFRASGGRLSCLTCHDPHVQPPTQEKVAYFRGKCLTCHTDSSCRLSKDRRAVDDCVGCHMPKRNVPVISHSALTNHRIPARAEEPFPPTPQNETGVTLLNPAEGKSNSISDVILLRAYAELAGQRPDYAKPYLDLLDRLVNAQPRDPFVQAALGHQLLAQGKIEEALPHLSQAVSLNELAVYEDLAKALTNLGKDDDAVACLQRAARAFPFDGVLLKSLILQDIKTKQYSEARQEMQRYVDLFPQDSFMRGLLNRVSQ